MEAHALFHDTSYAATRQELSNDLKVKVDHVSHISATHAFQTGGAVPTDAAFSAKAKALVAGSATPSRRRARRLSAANMIGFGLAFANQTEPNGGSNSPHAHHRGSKAPSPRTALLAGRVDKGAQRGIDSEADVRDLWSVPRRQESRRTNVTGSTRSLHTAHSKVNESSVMHLNAELFAIVYRCETMSPTGRHTLCVAQAQRLAEEVGEQS